MALRLKKEHMYLVILISVGIFLRFFVMCIGHNYDFESYCVVGEISGNFRNVYAETYRYNYGPIFLIIQGVLYKIAYLFPNWELAYRVLMVSTLTLADLGIACFIANRYDIKKSMLFFLNPVSIIITGYHNQFDNIAVFLALLSILFYNEDESFNKKDFFFVAFLSLSLITKHILFIFPLFIILKKGLPIKKRLLFTFVPPMAFLVSFLPFALQSSDALNGIIHNVFLYKSFNNAPLLSIIYRFIGFPMEYSIIVFGLLMALTAFICRNIDYEKQIFVYLISMVAFSSAIANQYLVIPIVAIIVLETGIFKYIYILMASIYLILQSDGLGLLNRFIVKAMPQPIILACDKYTQYAYVMLAWVLFISLLYYLFKKEQIQKSIIKKTHQKTIIKD
jgi:hypothetical protein